MKLLVQKADDENTLEKLTIEMKNCGWYDFRAYKPSGHGVYKFAGINGNKCKAAIEHYVSIVTAVTSDPVILQIWKHWHNIWSILNSKATINSEQVHY